MSKKQYSRIIDIHYNFDMPKLEKRKLKGKKVMLPLSANYNNRLSHSEDVERIAEKIYESLKNQQIKDGYIDTLVMGKIRTMAKWHDVGHCPYGHSGEEALNSLISENGEFYWDSFYSGYKHNLLSAKILLDLKINVSWDIIDAVIKHSSVLPKNFNLSRANASNILKLNYIFNCDRNNIIDINGEKVAVNNSWYFFVKYFISNFPCQLCNLPKYDFFCPNATNEVDKIIKICEKSKNDCKYCVIKDEVKNIKYNITQYLLFPYPLTLNGEILRLADEISALVRDIEFYSSYLKGKHINEYQIIKEKILDRLNILKSVYLGQGREYSLIDKVITLISRQNNAEDLIEYLVNSIIYEPELFEIIENKKFNSIPVIVKWDNKTEKNYCKPLLDFKEPVKTLFDEIKKCIYGIIHNDSIISSDNKEGIKQLKTVFNFYYNNPSDFLKKNKHLNEELNVITDVIRTLSCENLCEKINFAKLHLYDGADYMKLLNSFRREISFYIARVTESELDILYNDISKNK